MVSRTSLETVVFVVDVEEYEAAGEEGVRRVAAGFADEGVSELRLRVTHAPDVTPLSFEHRGVSCRVLPETGGRESFVDALGRAAEDVEAGRLEADSFDASDLETRLSEAEPDMMVVCDGGGRLPDALLWGAVYSEIRFVDSWLSVDAEAVRRLADDFRATQRRYGR